MEEMNRKANLYEKTGLIPVFDYSAAVVKSDSLMTTDLVQQLKDAAALFENVADEDKDWHPGSKDQVLDLVHPSLWPLIYGRSRILLNKTITVDNCLDHCGMGEVAPVLAPEEAEKENTEGNYSGKFQWLPCDVSITDGKAKIDSYINNAHPRIHSSLYSVVEQFISKALPAWDLVYRWPKEFESQRIVEPGAAYTCIDNAHCATCDPRAAPARFLEAESTAQIEQLYKDDLEGRYPALTDEERELADELWDIDVDVEDVNDPRVEWFIRKHPMTLTKTICPAKLPSVEDVRSDGFFNGASGIQVIVKLANIHLTPDDPWYNGGTWHLEGLMNEHICATALYYYDSDNIQDSHLEFRTMADREDLSMEFSHEQNDYLSINRVLAISSSRDTMQQIGAVNTRQGRALFFPNVYQHRVRRFGLADPTKPGHRKILALFLVDPAIKIISTANVPPQQLQWWTNETGVGAAASKLKPLDQQGVDRSGEQVLPPEVGAMIVNQMDFPIGETEAKKIREEFMAERKVVHETDDGRNLEWNFCEH